MLYKIHCKCQVQYNGIFNNVITFLNRIALNSKLCRRIRWEISQILHLQYIKSGHFNPHTLCLNLYSKPLITQQALLSHFICHSLSSFSNSSFSNFSKFLLKIHDKEIIMQMSRSYILTNWSCITRFNLVRRSEPNIRVAVLKGFTDM